MVQARRAEVVSSRVDAITARAAEAASSRLTRNTRDPNLELNGLHKQPCYGHSQKHHYHDLQPDLRRI